MAQSVGLIAGMGELPRILADRAAGRGERVVIVRALKGAMPQPPPACVVHDVFVGHWNGVVETLKREGVARVYLVGKVSRQHMYGDYTFDERCLRILASLTDKNDDALVLKFIEDLESEGIKVGPQLDYLDHLCLGPGVLTERAPAPDQWDDIRRGYRVAKGIAALDVGQTVVMKRGGVLAVEAVEGTDQAIRRGCSFGRGGAVVVKVAKPNQDPRFDVPTIGADTLDAMAESGGSVLAIEARSTLAVEREAIVNRAERLGIALVSYEPGMEASPR